jgi:predicted MFS family arabinose efflux permease
VLISIVGTPTAFLVNAASYVAVIAGLKLMRPAELRPAERKPRAKGQLREALVYVRARPHLWTLMIVVFFVSTFGMNFSVTTALMARGVFGVGAGAFGLGSTVLAVGALVGALLAARRKHPGARLLLATAFAFGVLEVLNGLMPTFWTFLLVLFPVGIAMLTFTTAANSATQLATTADMRGRVMGLYLLVFLGGAPFGSPLAGWVGQAFGPRISLIAGGLISAGAAAAVALVLAHSRQARVRDYLRPSELLKVAA